MSNVLSFKKPEQEVNFKVFARYVGEGNIEDATKILRDLLECDFEQAEKMTKHFKTKLDGSPAVIMQTMHLRNLVEQGKNNEALFSIQDLFGATGPNAIFLLEVIKKLA